MYDLILCTLCICIVHVPRRAVLSLRYKVTHTRGATNTTACIVQYSMEQLGAVCAYYSFTAGSEAEGCAVELESEAHTHLFNMSRSTSGGGELSESVLDCFTVGGAGGYSIHVYEIQCNGELRQRSRIALIVLVIQITALELIRVRL